MVDHELRTSVSHIYAAGDVLGGYEFSHFAGWQAFQAARNALLPGHSSGQTDIVPWVTFTDPEVARVGLGEQEARSQHGDDLKVCRLPIEKIDRAVCEDDRNGFIKILAKTDGSIVGATIIGERAGEAITEIVTRDEEWIDGRRNRRNYPSLPHIFDGCPAIDDADGHRKEAIRYVGQDHSAAICRRALGLGIAINRKVGFHEYSRHQFHGPDAKSLGSPKARRELRFLRTDQKHLPELPESDRCADRSARQQSVHAKTLSAMWALRGVGLW